MARSGSAEVPLLEFRTPFTAFDRGSEFFRDGVPQFFRGDLAVAIAIQVLEPVLHPLGRLILRDRPVAVAIEPPEEVPAATVPLTRCARSRTTSTLEPAAFRTGPISVTRPFRSRTIPIARSFGTPLAITRPFRPPLSIAGPLRSRTIAVTRSFRPTVAFRRPTVTFPGHLPAAVAPFTAHPLRPAKPRPAAEAAAEACTSTKSAAKRRTDQFEDLQVAVAVAIQLLEPVDDAGDFTPAQPAILVAIKHSHERAPRPSTVAAAEAAETAAFRTLASFHAVPFRTTGTILSLIHI